MRPNIHIDELSIIASEKIQEKKYWEKQFSGSFLNAHLSNNDIINCEYSIEYEKFSIQDSLYKKIDKLTNNSVFRTLVVLKAVFLILLKKISGSNDIILCTPILNKEALDKFINVVLPIRYTFNSDISFKDLILYVKDKIIEADKYQDYPIELISEIVKKNGYDKNICENGILIDELQNKNNFKHLNVNFYISFSNKKNSLIGNIHYNNILFDKKYIQCFIEYFINVIEQVLENNSIMVSQIELLMEKKRNKLLGDLNNTKVDYPSNKSVIELFEEQVKINPDKTAIISNNLSITYSHLNKKANQLGNYLINQNLNCKQIIGIFLEDNVDIIVSILAILKTGNSYLPIDIRYPDKRIQNIIKDSNIEIILTQNDFVSKFGKSKTIIDIQKSEISKYSIKNLSIKVSPDDILYTMYTSGSTGKPKGVMVCNRNVIRLVINPNYINLKGNERILQTASFNFDASTFELWGTLLNGCSLYLTKQDDVLNAENLKYLLFSYQINVIWLTSALFNQLFTEDPTIFSKLDYLIVGGDALYPLFINKLRSLYKNLNIINGYGPTENTTFSTCFSIDKQYDNIPIGRPISNSSAYILNQDLQIQPIGIFGELYVGGDGISKGYLNNPELTNEKFVINPFQKNELLYKTGDIVRLLPDGNIEFKGRKDNQVKVRGFRIEILEMYKTLKEHHKVKNCIVIPYNDKNIDNFICAYIVWNKEYEKNNSTDELRRYLSESLPDFMIPSYFMEIEKIPLNINGKVDKTLLPKPSIDKNNNIKKPTNDIQKELINIWSEVLNIPSDFIGIDTNFFELGGHSLRAARVISKINRNFSLNIPFAEIFQLLTIENISKYIENRKRNKESIITRLSDKENYELSSAQKRLFFIHQLNPNSTSFNISLTVLIKGTINPRKIEEVFKILISRHETLRTSFILENDVPVQVIHDKIDFLVNYSKHENEKEVIDKYIKPFNLEEAPLIRVSIISSSNNKHIMVIDMHHIISDGTSIEVLLNDFIEIYKGNNLSDLKIQYKDYAYWYNDYINTETVIKQSKYWLNLFKDKIPQLNLPIDYPRSNKKTNKGDTVYLDLDYNITKKINKLLSSTGTTFYQFMLTVYNILLNRCTLQNDIVIGSPMVNRKHYDSMNLIGNFINMVSFRNQFENNIKFIDLLNQIKKNTIDVYKNQDHSFDKLVSALKIQGNKNRHPIFDTVLAILDINFTDIEISEDFSIEPYRYEKKVIQHDLLLSAFFIKDCIGLSFDYSVELFKKSTISSMINNLYQIIKVVTHNYDIKINEIQLIHGYKKTLIKNERKTLSEFKF